MKEIIGILSGLLLVMIVDRPKVDLPEEYKAMEAGDLLKCDSVINGKIYLSYGNK